MPSESREEFLTALYKFYDHSDELWAQWEPIREKAYETDIKEAHKVTIAFMEASELAEAGEFEKAHEHLEKVVKPLVEEWEKRLSRAPSTQGGARLFLLHPPRVYSC